MDYVDIYCERLAPGLLAEPLNLITNLAFIIAAIVIWPRIKGDFAAQLLAVVLASIGVASGLFHSFATSWTGAADSLSILVFILIYLFFAMRRLFAFSSGAAAIGTVAFIPYAAAVAYLVNMTVGSLNGSFVYIPVPVLILIFAFLVRREFPVVARGFVIGVLILSASLFFRSIDEGICGGFPIGTHFLWHCLNGVMLAWMILVLHRVPFVAR